MIAIVFSCVFFTHVFLAFCLTVGETLRFTLSPELVAEEVLLYSDYPSKGRQYKRDNYAVLEWTYRGKQPHWDPDRFIDICIDRAGTFKFYFCRTGESKRWVCHGCVVGMSRVCHGCFTNVHMKSTHCCSTASSLHCHTVTFCSQCSMHSLSIHT